MDWFVKAFLKASLGWLALGVTLGLAMAIHRPWAIYRTAHMHINLLGFVAMMIAGVAYHVIPRFTGHALHSRQLAGGHWWMANAGLALMVTGFVLAPHGVTSSGALLATGALLSAAGLYSFVFNLWRTIDGRATIPAVPLPVKASPVTRRLPLADIESS